MRAIPTTANRKRAALASNTVASTARARRALSGGRSSSSSYEELVPISGRQQSLINPPSGCHFHPRCPYVREDHKKIDPPLQPVIGDPDHQVACLLAAEVRKRIWRGLQAGESPGELRRAAAGSAVATAPNLAVAPPAEELD